LRVTDHPTANRYSDPEICIELGQPRKSAQSFGMHTLPFLAVAFITTCQGFSRSFHIPLRNVENSGTVSSCRWRMEVANEDLWNVLSREADELTLSGKSRERFFMKMMQKEKEKEIAVLQKEKEIAVLQKEKEALQNLKEKDIEIAVLKKEKEIESAVKDMEFKFNCSLAKTKNKACKMGQRALYESFLAELWNELKKLNQTTIDEIRSDQRTSNFPKDAGNSKVRAHCLRVPLPGLWS
jgi:hypothetical protein